MSAIRATSSMLDRALYVALSRRLPGADLAPRLQAHLEFMIGLEERGILFASGPFFGPDGSTSGAGMSIVRAGSLEEARAILSADPFVVAGLRIFDLHEWHIMEGSLQLTVLASRQRGLLP
ncbi:MAG TPA: YciI family protein [Kofleriaceae bacterium]|nr:YciI family protein [Kofleriaceae bacterium]